MDKTMTRFKVTYIGMVGLRSCFWDASSETELRSWWETVYPNLAIRSVEVDI